LVKVEITDGAGYDLVGHVVGDNRLVERPRTYGTLPGARGYR